MNKTSPLRTVLLLALVIVALSAIIVGWRMWSAPAMPETPITAYPALPASCRNVAFEGDDFIACTADPATQRIVVAHRDQSGQPLLSLEALARRTPFAFAMNAGMYHEDNSPVGLYVEGGDYATQSGPMLVINGAIHPRFEPDGTSRHVRNGVGVDSAGRAVFAISRTPVSLGKFARLFRDGLGCQNALFFDGAISALHDGKTYLVGGQYPVGPIVAVMPKVQPASQ